MTYYTVEPLDLPVGYTFGQATNVFSTISSTYACGSIDGPGVDQTAVLWTDGTPSLLNPLAGQTHCEAWSVNSSGQVVGRSRTTAANSSRAVLWNASSTPTQLDMLSGSDLFSIAYDINESGFIVGYIIDVGNDWHAVRWNTSGVPTDLAFSGVFEIAYTINDSGNIAGEKTVQAFDPADAVFYDGSVNILEKLSASDDAGAFSINSNDEVCGVSENSPISWDSLGNPTDLSIGGATSGAALGINDSGVVVGYSDDDAVVWANASPEALPFLPGGAFAQANAVDTFGLIVGASDDGVNFVPSVWARPSGWDVLSTVASIDHDVLTGQEPDQHHSERHRLSSELEHTGGFVYKTGINPAITDTDITDAGIPAAADGQVAVTYDVLRGTALVWTRLGGIWSAVEATE